MDINLRLAKEEEIDIVNEHYNEIGFKESIFENEIIVIAEMDNRVAGLGRLQNINGTCAELGGIYVRPEYRKHGIARKVVNHLLHMSKDYNKIYCIPFAHLGEFYRSFGFTDADRDSNIPCEVLEKLDWCNDQYESDTLLLEIENK